MRTGKGHVIVEFQKDVDLQVASAEMRDRLDRIMPEMPDEIEQVMVRGWDANDIPIMAGSITFPPGSGNPRFLMDTYIEPLFVVLKAWETSSFGARRTNRSLLKWIKTECVVTI